MWGCCVFQFPALCGMSSNFLTCRESFPSTFRSWTERSNDPEPRGHDPFIEVALNAISDRVEWNDPWPRYEMPLRRVRLEPTRRVSACEFDFTSIRPPSTSSEDWKCGDLVIENFILPSAR